MVVDNKQPGITLTDTYRLPPSRVKDCVSRVSRLATPSAASGCAAVGPLHGLFRRYPGRALIHIRSASESEEGTFGYTAHTHTRRLAAQQGRLLLMLLIYLLTKCQLHPPELPPPPSSSSSSSAASSASVVSISRSPHLISLSPVFCS